MKNPIHYHTNLKPVPYYLEVLLKDAVKPIRILRETKDGLEQAKDQFKNHKLKYLGQVKSNLWLDGDNKGKKTA